jgi:anti-anti-sigma factor
MARSTSRNAQSVIARPVRTGPAPLLAWSAITAGPHAELTVRGELTTTTAARLREAMEWLHDGGHWRITVDLAGITACDGAGVNALVAAFRQVVGSSGQLRLTNPSVALRRLLGLPDDPVMRWPTSAVD